MFLRETNFITLILTRTPSTIRPFAEQYPSHHRVIINPKLPFHPLLFPSSNPITSHDFDHNLCHDSRIINTWSENYDYTFLHRGASFVSPTVSTLANDHKRHLHRISRNSVSLRQLTYKVSLHSFTSPTTFSSSPFPFHIPPPFTTPSIANRVICPSWEQALRSIRRRNSNYEAFLAFRATFHYDVSTLARMAPRAICHDCPKFHPGFNVSVLHDGWFLVPPLASPLVQFSNDNAPATSRCPLSDKMGLHTYRAAETCSPGQAILFDKTWDTSLDECEISLCRTDTKYRYVRSM